MKKLLRILSLVLIVAAIVMMLMPGSAAMKFLADPDTPIYQPISYLSRMAIGYANYPPLIALALAVIWCVRTGLQLLVGDIRLAHLVLGVSSLFFSVATYNSSLPAVGLLGLAVPLALGAAFALQLAASFVQTVDMRRRRAEGGKEAGQ